MNKYYKKLELDKILDLLAEQTYSDACREKALKLKPSFDEEEIRTELKKTDDAFKLSAKFGTPRFRKIKDLSMSLRRCKSGSALSFRELLDVADILRETNMLCDWFSQCESMESSLAEYFRELYPIKQLEQRISESIISEEEMSDAASAELSSIRKRIVRQGMNIREQLDKLIKSRSTQKFLQEAIVTMRDGRYVVPVRSEYKNEVAGLVHDTSATGQTFFIEPMSVVEANNEIRVLKSREQAEIERITLELSGQVGENADSIANNFRIAQILELYFAKANLGAKMRGAAAKIVSEPRVVLNQARHPLINPDTVVPISVEIGGKYESLIITGPNTGGKTVSLKTVGLFTLMGQAGLHIPALDRSELAIFENVYADIGDEQSIEQSLSTFSSHMTNIVSFLKHVDEHSLVLFDELNAGTDPTEGAALAIAILSYLHQRGIRTMATTHYSELKVFALSTPGVENACCEFDVETLSPTYRLLIGIPGKSNAFAIAGKLGLPDYIIEDAKTHLTEQDESFEDLLTDLETSKRTIRKEQEEIEHYKRELARLEEETRQKRDKLEEQRDRIIREANEKAHEILADAKETADETMRNFHKFGKANISVAEMEKERERLRKKMNATQNSMKTDTKKPKKAYKPSDFKLGESVKVLSMNLTGSVTSLPDSKGNVTVQMGILRSTVNISDLEIIDEAPAYSFAKRTRQTGKGKVKMGKSLAISPEINLLGKTVDEAIAELDKYLDDASLAHLSSVRIVHGKGTGALRAGIHKYLKRQKHVKSFRLGAFGEGDAGVTIAELK